MRLLPPMSENPDPSTSSAQAMGLQLFHFVAGGAGPAGVDDGGDAAAWAELAVNVGPDGVAGFDDVLEDLIDDVFLEDAEVAIGEEIFLPGFELKAALAGHVAELDDAEVGESGLGADGGELGIVDEDFVGRELILPGFDGGKREVEAGFGVLVGVAWSDGFGNGRHTDIVGPDCRQGPGRFRERCYEPGTRKVYLRLR